MSTDCRGRLGGTGISPTFQLILLRSQICVASHVIFGKKPYLEAESEEQLAFLDVVISCNLE